MAQIRTEKYVYFAALSSNNDVFAFSDKKKKKLESNIIINKCRLCITYHRNSACNIFSYFIHFNNLISNSISYD